MARIVASVAFFALCLTAQPAAAGDGSWLWPVDRPGGGPPSLAGEFDAPDTPYGPGHRGIDLPTLVGAPVRAVAGGTVTFAGSVAGTDVITIDHGIMEHAERVAVVPAEIGWSDVGDWSGLGELIEQDALGNSVRGELLSIDTTNSVIWSETGRMVAVVGLDNIIVVDTDDALLVVDRAQSQEVKKVVAELKASRKELS